MREILVYGYDTRDLDNLSDRELLLILEMSKPEYHLHLYNTNVRKEARLNELYSEAWQHLNQYKDIAVMRVGSGARLDGGGNGEAEFIYLVDDTKKSDHVASQYHMLLASELLRPTITFPPEIMREDYIQEQRVEYKLFEADGLLSYYSRDISDPNYTPEMFMGVEKPETPNQSKKPYPERILDSKFIAGNSRVWAEARARVIYETIGNNRIIEGLEERRRSAKRLCETGIQKWNKKTPELVQFDKESGTFFYDPENKVNGVKESFLRYTQIQLNVKLFKFFKSNNTEMIDIYDMPASIIGKIQYVLRKGWPADKEALVDIAIGYMMAAQLNAVMKFEYERNGVLAPVELSFGKSYFDLISQKLLSNLEEKFIG